MPDSNELNKENYGLWKRHPITRVLFKELRETRSNLRDLISSGETLTGEAGATAERTARMIGQIEGINLLLEVKFEDEEGAQHELSN